MKELYSNKAYFPNSLTTLNALCGFLSIVYANEYNLFAASLFIGTAALFDALDGIMARITKSASKFGVELDSLADAISFGAAPAFLAYKSGLEKLGIFGALLSSLLLIFGIYRLARFNSTLTNFDKKFFYGLPIPSSAITISSFVFLFAYSINENKGIPEQYLFFYYFLIPILSLLMISKIKYETFPKFTFSSFKEKPIFNSFFILSLILIFATSGRALFYIFCAFILLGIVRHIYYKLFTKKIEV